MPTDRRWKTELGWWSFVLLACAHFSLTYAQRCPPFLTLQSYAAGQAALPYQARVLMAWVLKSSVDSTFVTWVATMSNHFVRDRYEVVTIFSSALGMLVAIWATRRSLTVLTADARFAQGASLLVLWMSYFMLAVPYGLTYSLPYDVPSLGFFALGLMLVIAERTWLLPLLIGVGTLNRETICFVILFYAVWTWVMAGPRPVSEKLQRVTPMVLLLSAIWVGIKLYLRMRFAHNAAEAHGNGLFQTLVLHNLSFLVNPSQWPLFASLFGFTLPVLWLGRRWIRHRPLEAACAILIPAWFLLMLVVGVIVEVRVFNELSALVSLAVGMMVFHRFWVPARGAK